MSKTNTIHQPKTTEADARAYIDSILVISRKHGMITEVVPASTYEAAVTKAMRAFEGMSGAAKKSA